MAIRSTTGAELSPVFGLKIDNRAIDSALTNDVIAVSFTDKINAIAMAEIVVQIFDSERMRYKYMDNRLIDVGAKLELSMGYNALRIPMLRGEIVALEPRFATGMKETMLIRTYDLMHRFTYGRKVRTFINRKDSQIVSEIAREYGMRSETHDTGAVNDQVIQNNVNDFTFMLSRATKYHYEMYMQGGVFHFTHSRENAAPDMELRFGRDFGDFRPRLAIGALASAVEIREWDEARKQPLRGKAQSETSGRNAAAAPEYMRRKIGPVSSVITNRMVENAADAERMAQAALSSRADTFIEGRIALSGNPRLTAGANVTIAGVGGIFNGRYYITQSRHTLGAAGYTTTIDVRRSTL